MNKYFVIYRVPVESMDEWMKNTSPEERQKQTEGLGKAMMDWTQKNEKSIVERGWPLGKTKRVTKGGSKDIRNDLNYACIVQAESHDAAVAMFNDNPHIATIGTSFIDVMEIPRMEM